MVAAALRCHCFVAADMQLSGSTPTYVTYEPQNTEGYNSWGSSLNDGASNSRHMNAGGCSGEPSGLVPPTRTPNANRVVSRAPVDLLPNDAMSNAGVVPSSATQERSLAMINQLGQSRVIGAKFSNHANV